MTEVMATETRPDAKPCLETTDFGVREEFAVVVDIVFHATFVEPTCRVAIWLKGVRFCTDEWFDLSEILERSEKWRVFKNKREACRLFAMDPRTVWNDLSRVHLDWTELPSLPYENDSEAFRLTMHPTVSATMKILACKGVAKILFQLYDDPTKAVHTVLVDGDLSENALALTIDYLERVVKENPRLA